MMGWDVIGYLVFVGLVVFVLYKIREKYKARRD
jgi:hypothetical protein